MGMCRRRLIVPLVALGLVAAGCGGGGSKPAASTAPSGGSGDATSILAGIKPAGQTGPQKLALNVAVNLKGQLKDPQASAFLGSGPITVDVSGPVDPAAKSADVTFAVKAGKINLAGEVRATGDKAWVQLNGKWYELNAGGLGSATSTSTGNVDPSKILAALGDPSKLITDARVVGSEDIEGIATDHVTGKVDTAEVVAAIGRIAGAVGSASGPISPDQLSGAAKQLEKFVKSATIDWWIGKADKEVHRFKLDADIVLDDKTRASSGLDGLTAALTLTTTPTASPSVSAPSGALPSDQLAKDLLPALLAAVGGTP